MVQGMYIVWLTPSQFLVSLVFITSLVAPISTPGSSVPPSGLFEVDHVPDSVEVLQTYDIRIPHVIYWREDSRLA